MFMVQCQCPVVVFILQHDFFRKILAQTSINAYSWQQDSVVLPFVIWKFGRSMKFGEVSVQCVYGMVNVLLLSLILYSIPHVFDTYPPLNQKRPPNPKNINKNLKRPINIKLNNQILRSDIFADLLCIPEDEIILKCGTKCIFFVSMRCILLYWICTRFSRYAFFPY